MTLVVKELKKLGWSDELIRAFTVPDTFPILDSPVTYTSPEPRCIDTETLVITDQQK